MDAVKLACRGGLSKSKKLRVADRIEKSNAFPNWVKRLRKEAGVIKNDICVNASCDDVQNNDTQNAKEAPAQKEASDTLELLFTEWYSSYPRKKDKQRAKKAFLKVMKLTGKNEKEAFGEYAGKPPAEKVAMMKQIATRQAEEKDTQYIPYPSTWLNGYRWQDETTNTAPTANTDIYTELYADEADNIPIQDI